MGDKSTISWTDASWNPVTGCSKISAGCLHCYAETLSLRQGWSKKAWTAANAGENVILHRDRLELPLRWKKPRKIFVNSMSDLFHENVPFDFIDEVFEVMSEAEQHIFQVLTKRPERFAEWFRQTLLFGGGDFYPHIWIGVSAENQHWAEVRIPTLAATWMGPRFVSVEPMLEPVDLMPYLTRKDQPEYFWPDLNWVIVGGESGPGFRPMNLDWARTLRDQCVANDVPFWFKQIAGPRPGMGATLDGVEWHQFPVQDAQK